MAKSVFHLLILVNQALVTNFDVANMSFNAIRENKIFAKISQFKVCILFSGDRFCLIYSVDAYGMLHYATFHIWVFTVSKSTHFVVTSVHGLTEKHKYIFQQMTF